MGDLRIVIDQMGREVTIPLNPKRVISLVPSLTEFLIDIDAPLVGRTKFCIHPERKVVQIPIVGGTKNFHLDKMEALKPDLIIGNKEENEKEGIEALASRYPVWMSDIATLEDAFDMMKILGDFFGKKEKTSAIVNECKSAMSKMKQIFSGRVVYLIWQNPWMAAGKGTFIDHLLTHVGYQNVIQQPRYPTLSFEEIKELNPNQILLSSEPFPFRVKHVQEIKSKFPWADVQLVDGELFSWYGSRLRKWSA